MSRQKETKVVLGSDNTVDDILEALEYDEPMRDAIVRAVNEREALLADNERLKKVNETLLETCKAIALDLENNGEIYGTDEKRIEILNEAIAQAEEKGD